MEDITNLLARGPLTGVIGCSSMADGNMISDETGSYTAPGSQSETTHVAAELNYQPTVNQSDEVIPVGTDPKRRADNSSYTPAPADWKMLPQNGYSEEKP